VPAAGPPHPDALPPDALPPDALPPDPLADPFADPFSAPAGETGSIPVRQIVVWRPDQAMIPHDFPGLGDLRDDTSHGRLLGRSYLRAQLGLSLMCLAIALAATTSYPVIAALAPAITKVTVAGLPLTLIVLGFAFYPVLLAIGWFYNRQARQLEARFTDLVNPRTRPPDV
jgi:hypothetical protein